MRVRCRGVRKYYGYDEVLLRVLEGVDLDVSSGRFIAIMGPSGSGKSSLLQLIGCLDRPAHGEIYLDETEVGSLPESQREQIRLTYIGFIYQNFNLLPTLSVKENVLLPMQLKGTSRREQEARCRNLMKMMGLSARLSQRVSLLSGGQKQKVAIARSLANLPRLLLADEPTGNLDEKSTKEVMEMLCSIKKAHRLTVIMVTHDPKVASYADEILLFDKGRLTKA